MDSLNENNKHTNSKIESIKSKYLDNRETWNFSIGIFTNIIGIIFSGFTIMYSPNNIIIALSIICCQVIVVIMTLITFSTLNHNKKVIDESRDENARLTRDAEELIKEVQEKTDMSMSMAQKILVFSKNINKRINNFLTLICDETDKYYCNVSRLQENWNTKSDNTEYVELYTQQLEEERKKYQKSLFNLYNRYIKGIMEETQSVIKYYLRSKGLDIEVSLSIKMFSRTYRASSEPKNTKIYTAFRDKNTYDNKKDREIGEKHFSVDLNGDFHRCLSKEWYIKNNIKNDDEDYLNENYPNSMRHYNCTAVVPIICDYKSDKQFYGFFCCDALNDNNDEVFDKNVANILYSVALTVGIFFDNMNSAWFFLTGENKEDYLMYLHQQIFKG